MSLCMVCATTASSCSGSSAALNVPRGARSSSKGSDLKAHYWTAKEATRSSHAADRGIFIHSPPSPLSSAAWRTSRVRLTVPSRIRFASVSVAELTSLCRPWMEGPCEWPLRWVFSCPSDTGEDGWSGVFYASQGRRSACSLWSFCNLLMTSCASCCNTRVSIGFKLTAPFHT